MKAAAFFQSKGKPAPSLPVKVRLVDDSGEEQQVIDAEAVFRFVSDRIKTDADADAAKALAVLESKQIPITPEIRAAYEQAHFLHAALRDKAEAVEPFFDAGPEQVRAMLMPSERVRLLGAYQVWIEQEFPDAIDPEKFKEAVADMGNFTAPALLIKYGYDITRRLLLFSLLTPSKSPTT